MIVDTLGLALRVGFSLAVVLGLLWLAARALRGQAGRGGAGVVEVVARQQVGRNAAVAVVRVADKALVLGVTDSGVSLVADADLDAVTAAAEAARVVREPVALDSAAVGGGPLAGSVLSPATWRATVAALRERTVRRA